MAVQAFLLKQVLEQLPSSGDSILRLNDPNGKEISVECEKLAVHQLSTAKFVRRDKGGVWVPTDEALRWKEFGDNKYLARHIHANVKFFGEALEAIDSNTSHADILRVAQEVYGLPWNSSDQVRRRIGWLRSLGFVELWGQRIVRTEKGSELLQDLILCPPEVARGETLSHVEGEESVKIENLEFPDLTQEELKKRKLLIGYIPRGKKVAEEAAGESALAPIPAIRELARLVRENPRKDDFQQASKESLGISQGSFNSMLHSARHMGLIEQVAFNEYSVNGRISELLEAGNEVEFVSYLHSKYAFFGELLKHLENPLSTSALVGVARDCYGISQLTNGEVRLRLGILENAGLAFRLDWQRFSRSNLGTEFVQKVTLQKEMEEVEATEAEREPRKESESVRLEIESGLRKFGSTGTDSLSFEEQVAEAFRFLGFRVEHIGGSGNTDVLATAELAPADKYKVIIDAKSSGSGVISESNVKFDALKDHKKKHKADFVIVVGPKFASRVKQWALDHSVALLEIDELIDVLRAHYSTPLGLMDFRDVLARGDLHVEELGERYQALGKRLALISRVMVLAFQEANDEDPLSGGSISEENISYVLRKEMAPRPSLEDVREVLNFLCGPMVAALEENKGKYKIVDSPENVMARLRGLGTAAGYREGHGEM
ncbi:restriction endonuclease [Nocardiopsis quinghaiensis]|uniref:restriction endonuclease n=1 Tax=Nocardiopsis quinghaiensis TaxID=464995 RepID=UPI00123BC32D|nr:restriction endonuclease [Nocardiopsis quinghaiensis]